MTKQLLLLPTPRHLSLTGEKFTLSGERLIVLDYEQPQALLFSARRLQGVLKRRCGLDWEATAGSAIPEGLRGVSLHVRPEADIPAQGYELAISAQGIAVTGADPAGVFYGVGTLIQIIGQSGQSLPGLRIRDWPDYPARGVMLDVSRERVPQMETLLNLVDVLAGWKINQLQLYTEHAFAYRQHPEVWQNVSPITGQEVLELDAYCRERFIELVPNQQSLGHLAPWLNLPRYKHLAEVEAGFQTPWGYREGSFSLCPTDPKSIEFLHGLYAELLPHFSSRMFNVGGDETWDVGQGRSKEACERLGSGRVYLNFLLELYREVSSFGRTPQFWGDIIVEHPDLIAELPKDMIALEWGYEADHPFDEHGRLFAASGIPFYVCPGTSSWCSIAGRTDNATANLLRAAEQGLKHGAIGYLNTDWGDYGHWQAWPVSYLGLMCGAAYSWSLESNREMDVAWQLSWHGFGDASGAMGRAVYDLGNLYQLPGIKLHNSSSYFWILQWPLDQIRSHPAAQAEVFEETLRALVAAEAAFAQANLEREDAGLIRAEFGYTTRLLRHACRRGLLAIEDDPGRARRMRQELGEDLSGMVEDFRKAWLERNRPGGLVESTKRMEKLRADYASE